jgi:hypothetical protein
VRSTETRCAEVKKRCTRCRRTKSVHLFNKWKLKNGYQQWCRKCEAAYRKENWLRVKENAEKWKISNPAKYKAMRRGIWLRSRYGISIAQIEQFYADCKHRCLICRKRVKQLCIDHCHKTKKVRGLLCYRCNFGLGNFKDNIELLKSAILYLRRHQNGRR